jgi:hypothetical protein
MLSASYLQTALVVNHEWACVSVSASVWKVVWPMQVKHHQKQLGQGSKDCYIDIFETTFRQALHLCEFSPCLHGVTTGLQT